MRTSANSWGGRMVRRILVAVAVVVGTLALAMPVVLSGLPRAPWACAHLKRPSCWPMTKRTGNEEDWEWEEEEYSDPGPWVCSAPATTPGSH